MGQASPPLPYSERGSNCATAIVSLSPEGQDQEKPLWQIRIFALVAALLLALSAWARMGQPCDESTDRVSGLPLVPRSRPVKPKSSSSSPIC